MTSYNAIIISDVLSGRLSLWFSSVVHPAVIVRHINVAISFRIASIFIVSIFIVFIFIVFIFTVSLFSLVSLRCFALLQILLLPHLRPLPQRWLLFS